MLTKKLIQWHVSPKLHIKEQNRYTQKMFLLERQPSENYGILPVLRIRCRNVEKTYTLTCFSQTASHRKNGKHKRRFSWKETQENYLFILFWKLIRSVRECSIALKYQVIKNVRTRNVTLRDTTLGKWLILLFRKCGTGISKILIHHRKNGKHKNVPLERQTQKNWLFSFWKLGTRVSKHLAHCGRMLNPIS
jgi:hypothetical protein